MNLASACSRICRSVLPAAALIGASLLLAACKSDSPTSNNPPVTTKHKYVVHTMNHSDGSGFLNVYDSIPTGMINNATGPNALQVSNIDGAQVFGKHLYTSANSTGERGIQKYGIDPVTGKLKDLGFIIRTGSNSVGFASETKGYYWDQARGALKVQIFNPTTMARTGEIDLSSLSKGAGFESVGERLIVARDGKLFMDVHYSDNVASSYFDDKYDTLYMAVVDIATDKLESVRTLPGVRGMGYASAYPHWDIDENGDLYTMSIGQIIVSDPMLRDSRLIRIRKGSTDFDRSFDIRLRDYQQGVFFTVAPAVRGGKIYIDYQNEVVTSDFSNFNNDIYHYYVIDPNTKVSTRIPGVPLHNFTGRCQPLEIDGKIYAAVVNATFNGFYTLEESGGKMAFGISAGGTASGLYKLE